MCFLKDQGVRFIVGGYLSAEHTHWGSRLTITNGRQLYEAINKPGNQSLRREIYINRINKDSVENQGLQPLKTYK